MSTNPDFTIATVASGVKVKYHWVVFGIRILTRDYFGVVCQFRHNFWIWRFSGFLRLRYTSGNTCGQVIMTTPMKTRWPCFAQEAEASAFHSEEAFLRGCMWQRENTFLPHCHAATQKTQKVILWAVNYFCSLLSSCCFIPEASHQLLY